MSTRATICSNRPPRRVVRIRRCIPGQDEAPASVSDYENSHAPSAGLPDSQEYRPWAGAPFAYHTSTDELLLASSDGDKTPNPSTEYTEAQASDAQLREDVSLEAAPAEEQGEAPQPISAARDDPDAMTRIQRDMRRM
jgi:hypothetical protein